MSADVDLEAASRCPKADPAVLGHRGSALEPLDIHRPKVISVDSSDDEGRVTLRVRCVRCGRRGLLDLDIATSDAYGVYWNAAK